MRILILGGTVFLGRWTARAALDRGHDVTLLHRGRHGRELFAGEAEHLLAGRTGPLDVLHGRRFDAAIDTSGYEPGPVRRSSEALAACSVQHLSFVSSVNAYPGWPEQVVDEDSPVWESGDDYGPLKVACERAAEAALPGRVAVLRVGLLVGPRDHVFRLPWWVQRVARGGELLAPGPPDRPLQVIDARDLATWMVDLAEGGVVGTFNATSPPASSTFAQMLEAATVATGSDAQPRWADDDALVAAGIEPWTQLPLWLPAAEHAGTWTVDTERAAAAGLRARPVAETVADVAAWLAEGGAAALPDWQAANRAPGLEPARERELLATLDLS
jgi:nucleoside-diphosphate-sugar epimerase